MLTEITGDILDVRYGVICHQVNYFGVMGGGVAATIAEKFLTEEQYKDYANYCNRAGRTALGSVMYMICNNDVIVANMFCQDDARAQGSANEGGITDYDCMRRCLMNVRCGAQLHKKRVYIPHNIGCGIAGGDWNIVKGIIQDVFSDSFVRAYIVSRKG